jgi:hypothetical protein
MGLSESEELELLQLQKAKALAAGQATNGQAPQSIGDAFKGSFHQAVDPLVSVAQKLHPRNLTWALPMAGAVAGTAIMPGAGTAAGAGLGSIAQKMANLVYGTTPPVDATTSIAGIPMAPKEAITPMLNTLMAGVPETTQGQAAGKAISSAYESAKPGFKKALSQVGQMLTGKSANKVRQVIEDPAAILPESLGGAKTVEDASAQYGQALDKSGLEKKLYGPFSEGKSEADKDANLIYAKWKSGKDITPQEAFNAKRATDKLWPAVVKERNAEDIREMSQFKTGMDDILSSQAGQFQKASKDYSRARLGSDFTQLLPRTKTGDISTVKSFLLPMVEPRKLPFMLASSPAVLGAGNLAAQSAMKGLNVVGSNPNARQALMGLLQQLLEKQQQRQQP